MTCRGSQVRVLLSPLFRNPCICGRNAVFTRVFCGFKRKKWSSQMQKCTPEYQASITRISHGFQPPEVIMLFLFCFSFSRSMTFRYTVFITLSLDHPPRCMIYCIDQVLRWRFSADGDAWQNRVRTDPYRWRPVSSGGSGFPCRFLYRAVPPDSGGSCSGDCCLMGRNVC